MKRLIPLDLVLYRFYAADGSLLYVGKTVNPASRFDEHGRVAVFYPETTTITLQRGFADHEALLAAELAAIAAEQPRYNTITDGGRVTLSKLTPDAVRVIRTSSEPVRVLAVRFGVKESCIYAARSGRRWRHINVPPVPSHRVHGAAKLTEAAIRDIRASGMKPGKLAAMHGVSRETIRRIRRGETWRWVS